MSKKEYARNLYSGTQTVPETLFGERIDIDEKLSTKFGIDSYPLEESSEDTATRQYHRISHGLSYLVADEYSSMDGSIDYHEIDFFDKRKEDFERFESEFRDYTASICQRHLIQYANLYSEVCQVEGIEPSYTGTMFPSPKVDESERQRRVLEILEDLDEGLGDEAVSSLE